MNVDERAILAANNNADLYEAMYSAHGLDYERLPFAFVGKQNPPPFYSNLTTLSPDHAQEIAQQIESVTKRFTGRIGLKDSFCQLELEGFDALFSASWIWRAGGIQTPVNWEPVLSEEDLVLWEDAWNGSNSPTPNRMFNRVMLNQSDVTFLGVKSKGRYEAGCIANRSDSCIGISNVFSRTESTQSASSSIFAQATAAVSSIDPLLPIVGYESGEDLESASAAGYCSVGELRILLSST